MCVCVRARSSLTFQLHQYAIEHVAISKANVVVAADIRGAVSSWCWTGGGAIDPEWGGTTPLSALLPAGEAFSSGTGALYMAYHDGDLVCRARGAYFGFNDTVLHTGRGGTASQLALFGDHLFFAVDEHIQAFSQAQGQVVARFRPSRAVGRRVVYTLSAASRQLAAAWGALIYLCDLQGFAASPFAVIMHVALDHPVRSLALISRYILAALEADAPAPCCLLLDPVMLTAETLDLPEGGLCLVIPIGRGRGSINVLYILWCFSSPAGGQTAVTSASISGEAPTHAVVWTARGALSLRIPRTRSVPACNRAQRR